jgi:hypothetical protein
MITGVSTGRSGGLAPSTLLGGARWDRTVLPLGESDTYTNP